MDFLDRIRTRAQERRRGTYLGERIGKGICTVQHDYDLANASGAAFRSDLNDALDAILSRNSGASAPGTTAARMEYVDTTLGVKRRRNAANSGWLTESTDDETRFMARSSNTALDASDIGKVVRATAGFTQTFAAVSTLGDGWYIDYMIDTGVTIVFDPNSTEQINGATTLTVVGPAYLTIWCDGTGFRTHAFTGTVMIQGAAGQLVVNTGAEPIVESRYSADVNGAYVFQQKSRHATLGSHTIVQNDDNLGGLVIRGSDGSAFRDAAFLLAQVDGTPGASDMPTRWVFLVSPDGSATPVERARIDSAGGLKSKMGDSTSNATAIGVANINTTAVGNVGAGTDTLMSYTLPANSLSANGKAIRITAYGTTANNANAKSLAFNFGSAGIAGISLTASQAGRWKYEIYIVRTGVGTQDIAFTLLEGVATFGTTVRMAKNVSGAFAVDETAAISINFTGAATADNDITQEFMLIEFLN